MDTPEWIIKYIEKLTQILGLGHWLIDVKMERDISGGHIAEARMQSRYLVAEIAFSETIQQNDEGYEAITHEILHLGQHAEDLALDRIIEMVPKKYRIHARNIWSDGNEQSTALLARALDSYLRKNCEASEKPDQPKGNHATLTVEPGESN